MARAGRRQRIGHAASVTVGVVGDFDPSRPTHAATETASSHAAHALGVAVRSHWLPTPYVLDAPLERFVGLLVAPGSPYLSVEGALRAIRYAREGARPLLATCGGFLPVVLEFARNVLGVHGAAHAEYEPDAAEPVIEPRIAELGGHPFFVATLFVPQLSSTAERPHPLVQAFLAAAARVERGGDRRSRGGSAMV